MFFRGPPKHDNDVLLDHQRSGPLFLIMCIYTYIEKINSIQSSVHAKQPHVLTLLTPRNSEHHGPENGGGARIQPILRHTSGDNTHGISVVLLVPKVNLREGQLKDTM